MRIFFIFFLVILCFEGQPVQAQESVKAQLALQDLNRIKPLQNPRYIQFSEILDRKLVDSHSKVLGEVDNIIVSAEGEISQLYVNFDRLHPKKQAYLDYYGFDTESMSNAYRLSFDRDQVEGLYRDLPKNPITPDGQEVLYDVSSFIGRPVVNMRNEKIGEVSEVLFEETARAVAALYVIVNYKTIRKKGIAIPFEILTFKTLPSGDKVFIPSEWSDSILDYVD